MVFGGAGTDAGAAEPSLKPLSGCCPSSSSPHAKQGPGSWSFWGSGPATTQCPVPLEVQYLTEVRAVPCYGTRRDPSLRVAPVQPGGYSYLVAVLSSRTHHTARPHDGGRATRPGGANHLTKAGLPGQVLLKLLCVPVVALVRSPFPTLPFYPITSPSSPFRLILSPHPFILSSILHRPDPVTAGRPDRETSFVLLAAFPLLPLPHGSYPSCIPSRALVV